MSYAKSKTSCVLSVPSFLILLSNCVKLLHPRSAGSNPYVIPAGGSNLLGSWGYIEAFRELQDQGVLKHFDDIVMATGSGGTICGMTVANFLTGSQVKWVTVCFSFIARFVRCRAPPRFLGGVVNGSDAVELCYVFCNLFITAHSAPIRRVCRALVSFVA